MKLGSVIDKMMKKTEKDTYEKDIKPILTITISSGEPDEEEEMPDSLQEEDGEIQGKFKKGY